MIFSRSFFCRVPEVFKIENHIVYKTERVLLLPFSIVFLNFVFLVSWNCLVPLVRYQIVKMKAKIIALFSILRENMNLSLVV
jgi:hypothetical protein